MSNTFDQYRESPASRRMWISIGVGVLIVTVIAIVVIGMLTYRSASDAPDDQPLISNESSGDGSGEGTGQAPAEANELIGTYSGEFRNAIPGAKAGTWDGVVSITGRDGLLAYPRQGCQVYLSQPQVNGPVVAYQAQSLNLKCNPQGTWEFVATDTGAVATYVEDGNIIVKAELERE